MLPDAVAPLFLFEKGQGAVPDILRFRGERDGVSEKRCGKDVRLRPNQGVPVPDLVQEAAAGQLHLPQEIGAARNRMRQGLFVSLRSRTHRAAAGRAAGRSCHNSAAARRTPPGNRMAWSTSKARSAGWRNADWRMIAAGSQNP